MPVSTRVDRSKDLTIFTATGELTFKEQIDALSDFFAAAPTKNALWDMRNITGSRVSSEELRQIISFVKRHEAKRTGGRTALVTSSDLDFGLGRMSHAYAEGEGLPWQVRAFRSMKEAMGWLNE